MANAFVRAVLWPTDVSWQVAFAFLWLDWVEFFFFFFKSKQAAFN